MAIFNRILNICVMLMAIAAAVFTWKLYERRNELRDRGDLLAKTIENAAKTLDEQTPESDQVLKTVIIGDKGKGPLGWIRYHKKTTNSDYIKSLTDFTAAVEKVRTQRDTLSGYVVKVGGLFYEKEDALNVGELNDPSKSGEIYDNLSGLLKAYYDRDKYLTQMMIENNILVDESYSVKEITAMRDAETYKAAQAKLAEGINYFMTQNTMKTDTLQKIANTLGTERIGVTAEQVVDMKPAVQNTIAEKIVVINQELDRVVLLEQQVKQLREEIVAKQAVIDEKETIIQSQNTTIDTLNKQIINKDNKIRDLAAKLEMALRGDTGPIEDIKYDGKVIKVNYNYNYVVIDVDKEDKLVYGAQLTVARDREYIATVKITKVYKQYAVAEILPEDKVGEVLEGDRVLRIQL